MPGNGQRRKCLQRMYDLPFPILPLGCPPASDNMGVCGPLKGLPCLTCCSCFPHRPHSSPHLPSVTLVAPSLLEYSHGTQTCAHFPLKDSLLDLPLSSTVPFPLFFLNRKISPKSNLPADHPSPAPISPHLSVALKEFWWRHRCSPG